MDTRRNGHPLCWISAVEELMFTGLVELRGTVQAVQQQGELWELTVAPDLPLSDLTLGESIAIDGACLTVASIDNSRFTVQLSTETAARTVGGGYQAGDRVHLERSMRLNDRLGGHLVSGHIDTVGQVIHMTPGDSVLQLSIGYDRRFDRWVVEKGSIALNGISLTVNRALAGGCELLLIPYTLSHTNLRLLQTGSRCNLEFDLIAKYVDRQRQIDAAVDTVQGVSSVVS